MAKQAGRRINARPKTLRRTALALLALGFALGVAAAVAPGTQFEAARDGLFLMGLPLLLLGAVLLCVDWMASYTAVAQASWGHHENRPKSRPQRTGRTRRRRLGVFKRSEQALEFEASLPESPVTESRLEPLMSATVDAADWTEVLQPAAAPRPPQSLQSAVVPAADSPSTFLTASAFPPSAATPTNAAPPQVVAPAASIAESVDAVESPTYLGRVDPGPDTVIEEYVGYEGQERMLAVRDNPPPPPRELAWPNPPRTTLGDPTPASNEEFLEKLMDDVLSKIGTRQGLVPAAATVAAPAPAEAAPADEAVAGAVPAAAAVSAGAVAAPVAAPAQPRAPVWNRQLLEAADHWRFAAMVEKLYQQAGFATQLQAGHTMRGVVVLWLFSRHRPGMPASVVSCVCAPGGRLPTEEIVTLSELVKSRGLPRGQLATTATLDDASLQTAAALRVHLMDSTRLLELISQRNAEQQRALAARLA